MSAWLLTLLTATLLAATVAQRPHMLVKPSFLVILGWHVIIQWQAAAQSAVVSHFLPDPFAFHILVHGFPLIGLVGSVLFGQATARATWERFRAAAARPRQHFDKRPILLLAAAILVVVMIYLAAVPVNRTGLVVIFTDPDNSTQAREDSLKLIDSAIVRYGFEIMASCFAPLIVVLLGQWLIFCVRRRNLVHATAALGGIAAVILAVSVTGARGYSTMIVATMLAAVLFARNFRIRAIYLAAGMLLVVLPSTLLTILREGLELSPTTFFEYLGTAIFDRITKGPMEVGMYYVHYAQTHHFLGIGAIDKLAHLFNVPVINAPNLIGLEYVGTSVASVHANVGYVFSYYCYFGINAFPFCLLGLWLLDVALIVYSRLSAQLLLPVVASTSVACASFISADYTTTLVTHGFAVILVVGPILDALLARRRLRGAPPSGTTAVPPSTRPAAGRSLAGALAEQT